MEAKKVSRRHGQLETHPNDQRQASNDLDDWLGGRQKMSNVRFDWLLTPRGTLVESDSNRGCLRLGIIAGNRD